MKPIRIHRQSNVSTHVVETHGHPTTGDGDDRAAPERFIRPTPDQELPHDA
jgi:hypothetical protein